MARIELPEGYGPFVEALKARIHEVQLRAALAVNRELLALYWNVGRAIVERQAAEGWGTRVLERLGDDLQKAFPGVAGFSRSNVYRLRAFALAHPAETMGPEIVPQPVGRLAEALPATVADLPWGHHAFLLEKVKDPAARGWYAHGASAHGWSRAVLTAQIDTRLYDCAGKALRNFSQTLPPAQSDLARQALPSVEALEEELAADTTRDPCS